MKTQYAALIVGVGFLALAWGCEVPELPDTPGAGTAPATTDTAATEEPEPQRGTAATATADGEALPDPGDVEPVTEEGRAFTANDPVKGRRSRSVGGYGGAVFGARFWAEHQMTLHMINKNLQLFEATNSRYPRSNEEFMQAIIVDGMIDLPELPDDQEYFYDPEEPQEGLQVRLKQAQ